MSDKVLKYLGVAYFALTFGLIGAAFGSVQTAYWLVDQVETRFECIEK